jgi:anti-anti-sigma factor
VVDIRLTDGTATVVIGGELDPASTPSLAAQLRQVTGSNPQRLVFDLSGVGFIDCAAARLLAGTARSLPGGRLPVIRFPGPLVRRVFQLTGLDRHVELDG